jgi:Zinc dependent phospholipase C
MPAWYVHMESARRTALRLEAGQVPANFPIDVADAEQIGAICHRWRNYLAVGAIGPDLFYMLPDYANDKNGDKKGATIREIVGWVIGLWDSLDPYITLWEKTFGAVSTNNAQLASQLTGGLSTEISDILTELSSAITKAFEGLLASSGDIFGIFSSGPPQAYKNDAFYWADIFHYRRTYQFPFVLYQTARRALDNATTDKDRYDAETLVAFAVGWLTHCATDVTGHPFTNAKSGGPFRDHWQRHHLIELHIDSLNYSANHTGPCYGQIGESAVHFWTAFRRRSDGPYAGRDDGPAYDYFTGFPSYPTGDGPTDTATRKTFFDLDTGDLPDHLVSAIQDAMATVHPDGPKILAQDANYCTTDANGVLDGRPNTDAMAEMWTIVYAYLKLTGTGALAPRKPQPPDVFTDHSFPSPPGSDHGVNDDPSRGADVDSDDSFHWYDLLLALFAWAEYVVQIAVWLATIIPSLAADVLTYWARNLLYVAEMAGWNLYLLARRALVMTGFQMPNPEEIDFSLTTLGVGNSGSGFDIGTALDDPLGYGSITPVLDEPSGRATNVSSYDRDRLYPRNVVRDTFTIDPSLTDLLGLTKPLHYRDDAAEYHPSAWLAPWKYPAQNTAGDTVPTEIGPPVHSGPYVAGDSATVLVPGPQGDDSARAQLEAAPSPLDTWTTLNTLFGQDKHLGGPVDYGVYLVGKMAEGIDDEEFSVPDFNLDSDRGYAWKTWDWDRHSPGAPTPPTGALAWLCHTQFENILNPPVDWRYLQPCTPPHFFHADTDNLAQVDSSHHILEAQWYDPSRALRMHYLRRAVVPDPKPDAPDVCDAKPQTPGKNGIDWSKLGMRGMKRQGDR